MFIGKYYHTLESKGRVSLPKTFRDTAEWVVTRGLDGSLFLYTAATFMAQMEELSTRSFTKKLNRDFIRLMANEAQNVFIDRQGRVQLPEYLIEYAHLKKSLVIVGSLTYLEIWDRDTYHLYLSQLEPQASDIAEQLSESSHDSSAH